MHSTNTINFIMSAPAIGGIQFIPDSKDKGLTQLFLMLTAHNNLKINRFVLC